MGFWAWLKRTFEPEEVVSAKAFGVIAGMGMEEKARRIDTERERDEARALVDLAVLMLLAADCQEAAAELDRRRTWPNKILGRKDV